MEKAYIEKIEKEAQTLLDSINEYLLKNLGIVIPSKEENTLKSRMFYVGSEHVIGSRFDPRKYTNKYKPLFFGN